MSLLQAGLIEPADQSRAFAKLIAQRLETGLKFLVRAQRRERRLNRNTNAAHEAKIWADRNGFTFRVNNEGHHWMWQKGGFVAEWWPSSAKLVLNRSYDHSFPAHDWAGVIAFLESKASAM